MVKSILDAFNIWGMMPPWQKNFHDTIKHISCTNIVICHQVKCWFNRLQSLGYIDMSNPKGPECNVYVQ